MNVKDVCHLGHTQVAGKETDTISAVERGVHWAPRMSSHIRRAYELSSRPLFPSGLRDSQILSTVLLVKPLGQRREMGFYKPILYFGLRKRVVSSPLSNHESQWTTDDVLLEDGRAIKCGESYCFFVLLFSLTAFLPRHDFHDTRFTDV